MFVLQQQEAQEKVLKGPQRGHKDSERPLSHQNYCRKPAPVSRLGGRQMEPPSQARGGLQAGVVERQQALSQTDLGIVSCTVVLRRTLLHPPLPRHGEQSHLTGDTQGEPQERF